MINKNASATDETMISIYRFLFLTFITFVVIGVSGISYGYEIDLKDTDSMLMNRAVVDCLAVSGVINLDVLKNEDLFEYCGFNDLAKEDYFVTLTVNYGDDFVEVYYFGNEDLKWVSYIFENNLASENIEAYKPGYYYWEYPVRVFVEGEIVESNFVVGVVRKSEK